MIRNSTLVAFWERFKQGARYYVYGLYHEVANKNIFLWAQAIAFKVLVTIVPVVVLAAGIVGQVIRSAQPFAELAEVVRDFLPPSQSEQIIRFLEQLYNASGTLTLFGALGLFLSAWSLFITLRIAVSNAFEQDWHVERSIVGGYLFDARMVLQVGLLFTLTIGLSVFSQSLDSPTFIQWLGLDASWVERGWQRALRIIGLLTPFLITMAMFFQLLYFVPSPHPRKRSATLGAFVTAIVWEGAKQGFTLYATYVGRFDRYGGGSEGLAALGNVFGLIIAFVFWVYFSAIVLMLGAVIASLHDHRYRVKQSLPDDPESPPDPVQPPASPASSLSLPEGTPPEDASLMDDADPSPQDGTDEADHDTSSSEDTPAYSSRS
jgi:membrane protein